MYFYKISVLIPVFNAETYLTETIDSLLKQRLNKGVTFEVLFIDDGSTDGSVQICQTYAKKYSHFKYFRKENSGVSDTRNYGLKVAKGKYILFLDADDTLGEDTLQHVFQTFEKYQDKANILAYPLFTQEGEEITPHARSKNYEAEGVFHIDNYPYLNQCTMNTVIKNLSDSEKIYFDTNLAQSEDALFNSQMVLTTKRIIIANQGSYIYRIGHSSTVQKYKDPVVIKEMILQFFEKLIDASKNENGEIPNYIQSMILYELNWRFKQNTLFPYHLEETDLNKWMTRLQQIFTFIDNSTILGQPFMDFYHRVYFIQKFKSPIETTVDSSGIHHYCEGKKIVKTHAFTLVFNKIALEKNEIAFYGYVKALLLTQLRNLDLIITDQNGKRKVIELTFSPESYYKVKLPITEFYNFKGKLPLQEENTYTFHVEADGYRYKTLKYFENMVIFKHSIGSRFVVTKDKVIAYYDDPFAIKITDRNKTKKWARGILRHQNGLIHKRGMRTLSWFMKANQLLAPVLKNKKIWLYNDRVGLFDNAYLQFCHDIKRKDQVRRYYVVREEDATTLIPEKNKLIYGSIKHKILFYYSSLIITSFKDKVEYAPLSERALNVLYSELQTKLIYIQHGVLNAFTPWLYSKNKTAFDKFLISTHLEEEWLEHDYGYEKEDLIKLGMPRFDTRGLQKKKKKILLAPSWRKAFVEEQEDLTRSIDKEAFLSSDFYKELYQFIHSEELQNLLIKYDYILDVKMHPIFDDLTSNFN